MKRTRTLMACLGALGWTLLAGCATSVPGGASPVPGLRASGGQGVMTAPEAPPPASSHAANPCPQDGQAPPAGALKDQPEPAQGAMAEPKDQAQEATPPAHTGAMSEGQAVREGEAIAQPQAVSEDQPTAQPQAVSDDQATAQPQATSDATPEDATTDQPAQS